MLLGSRERRRGREQKGKEGGRRKRGWKGKRGVGKGKSGEREWEERTESNVLVIEKNLLLPNQATLVV